MERFHAAQEIAGRAVRDALSTMRKAHDKEVRDLRNRVIELELSLNRMQGRGGHTKVGDHHGGGARDLHGGRTGTLGNSFATTNGFYHQETSEALSPPSSPHGASELSQAEKEAGGTDRPVKLCEDFVAHGAGNWTPQSSANEEERDGAQQSPKEKPSTSKLMLARDLDTRGHASQRSGARLQKDGKAPTASRASMASFASKASSARSAVHYTSSEKGSCRRRTRLTQSEVQSEAERITREAMEYYPPVRRRHCKVVINPLLERFEKPYLQRVVEHTVFESMCALLIIINSVLVGLDVQWSTAHNEPNTGLEIASHVCSAGFLIELLLRLQAFKLGFFRGDAVMWNLFDGTLVIMSIVELIIQLTDEDAQTASIGSAMKTIKMLRIIRVIRVFRFCKELSLLVLMIIDSMKALIWALVMLMIILYVFAILFTANAIEYVKTADPILDGNVLQVHVLFGSIPKTLYSLFQTMLGGVSWGVMSDALLEVWWPLAALFFFYVSFVMLAVLNIITGVFVDNAVETAKSQRDVLVQKEFELKERYLNEMRILFNDMDDDGSGTLTLEEIREYFSDPRVRSYFQALGLDPNDTERLFRLIDDDGSGDVNVDEFLEGCMRLKGGARSIDVHQLLCECKRLESGLLKLEGRVQSLVGRMESSLDDHLIVQSY